jgi:hypothetical protein
MVRVSWRLLAWIFAPWKVCESLKTIFEVYHYLLNSYFIEKAQERRS